MLIAAFLTSLPLLLPVLFHVASVAWFALTLSTAEIQKAPDPYGLRVYDAREVSAVSRPIRIAVREARAFPMPTFRAPGGNRRVQYSGAPSVNFDIPTVY